MAETLRIALAQINPHVGALDKNADRIRRARAEAAALGADLVVTPEFSVGGYPPFARPPLVYLYLISLGGGSQDLGLGSAGTIILTAVVVIIGVVQLSIFSVGGKEDRA